MLSTDLLKYSIIIFYFSTDQVTYCSTFEPTKPSILLFYFSRGTAFSWQKSLANTTPRRYTELVSAMVYIYISEELAVLSRPYAISLLLGTQEKGRKSEGFEFLYQEKVIVPTINSFGLPLPHGRRRRYMIYAPTSFVYNIWL